MTTKLRSKIQHKRLNCDAQHNDILHSIKCHNAETCIFLLFCWMPLYWMSWRRGTAIEYSTIDCEIWLTVYVSFLVWILPNEPIELLKISFLILLIWITVKRYFFENYEGCYLVYSVKGLSGSGNSLIKHFNRLIMDNI